MNYSRSHYPSFYQPARGLALAGFLCGLGSMILFTPIAGVLGIVFSRMAKKRGNTSKMVPAGLICGIIGIILSVVVAVVGVLSLVDGYLTRDFCFGKVEGGYAVWSGTPECPADLEIPDSYWGKPVVKLEAYAFSETTGIVRVWVPSSVQVIGRNAFLCYQTLEEVYLAEGVTVIESFAFRGCAALKTVELPSTLQKIEAGAFGSCNSLETIRYHGTVEEWNTQVTLHPNWFGRKGLGSVDIICDDGTVTLPSR